MPAMTGASCRCSVGDSGGVNPGPDTLGRGTSGVCAGMTHLFALAILLAAPTHQFALIRTALFRIAILIRRRSGLLAAPLVSHMANAVSRATRQPKLCSRRRARRYRPAIAIAGVAHPLATRAQYFQQNSDRAHPHARSAGLQYRSIERVSGFYHDPRTLLWANRLPT